MDDSTLKLELSRFMAKLKADYTKSGKYNTADFDHDMEQLNQLAFMQMITNLAQLKPPAGKLETEQQLNDYLKSFSQDELQKALNDAANEIFGGYMESLYGKAA